MLDSFQPPYLGCAYYPEDWDESQMDYDIAMMKEAGINCARIGEFAWSLMEPRPGEFDFAWLHRVVDTLAAAGIAVVLGTPTATPPQWLSKMYPDVMKEHKDGTRASHGGRRDCCSNNPHYVEYCLRIVEKMAREFCDCSAVVGWQIDNEIYAGDGCFCPICHGKFADFLRERYGTVENLNKRWNTTTFSQEYECFEDVVMPRNTWHHPHLYQAWTEFQQESHVDFVHKQADLLHRYVKVPVGTDIIPFNGMDYGKLHSKLDVVQFNHYNHPDNLHECCLWFDYLRTMKDRPFWVTETSTCWAAAVAVKQDLRPDGFCVVNSFLPLALGGEANMYWLFRTHWGGHEIMHGAVLDSSGRPMHIFEEVQDTARLMEKSWEFLSQTKVQTPVAMHYSPVNYVMLEKQAVVDGVTPHDIFRFYRPSVDLGLRPDVIDGQKDLTDYKLLVSPLALTFEEENLQERISEWVKNGGVWVVGPLSDIRNRDGARYKDRPFGFLEKLTGARWCYGVPDHIHCVGAKWEEVAEADGAFSGDFWYDCFDETKGTPLATITSGHKQLVGKACILHCPVEKGHVILLGTFPDRGAMGQILSYACRLAHIPHGTVEGSVMVAERKGTDTEGVVLAEYGNSEGDYFFSGILTDVRTGTQYQNKVSLKPYEIMILKRDERQ